MTDGKYEKSPILNKTGFDMLIGRLDQTEKAIKSLADEVHQLSNEVAFRNGAATALQADVEATKGLANANDRRLNKLDKALAVSRARDVGLTSAGGGLVFGAQKLIEWIGGGS